MKLKMITLSALLVCAVGKNLEATTSNTGRCDPQSLAHFAANPSVVAKVLRQGGLVMSDPQQHALFFNSILPASKILNLAQQTTSAELENFSAQLSSPIQTADISAAFSLVACIASSRSDYYSSGGSCTVNIDWTNAWGSQAGLAFANFGYAGTEDFKLAPSCRKNNRCCEQSSGAEDDRCIAKTESDCLITDRNGTNWCTSGSNKCNP